MSKIACIDNQFHSFILKRNIFDFTYGGIG